MSAKKPLNSKQAKFARLHAQGMSRAKAYEDAYGEKKGDNARKLAYQLIATNSDVSAEIERIQEECAEDAKAMLAGSAVETVEILLDLRKSGGKDDNVKLRACDSTLDRIGLKAQEKIEHSGEVAVTLMDALRERRRQRDGGDA